MLDGRADREVYLGIAQVWEKGKNYEEMGKALDSAEKLSLSNEDKEGVFFLRGAMLEKQKKFDEAEAEFRKILKLDPKNAGALNYLGYMLADKNIRLPEALQMIQTALEQDPQNSAYLDSIGWVYFRMNKLDEAEKYLRMSLERLSKDPTVHDHLADVLQQQGKAKEAIAQWELSLSEWAAMAPSDKDPAEVAKVQKKLDAAKVKLAKDPGTPTNRKKN
jgi:tetratricopeptide (TPR) repeat protein